MNAFLRVRSQFSMRSSHDFVLVITLNVKSKVNIGMNHGKLFGSGQDTVARFPKFDNQPRRVNKSNLIILNMYF